MCSVLLRALPAPWTGDIPKYRVWMCCHECIISTCLTNLPWNSSHNLPWYSFVCLWRPSAFTKDLVIQTGMSRCCHLVHYHPSAELCNCVHVLSWPPLPRTVYECLCITRLTLQWCQSKSMYTISYYALADRRWRASYDFCGCIFPVDIEIIKDCVCKLHIYYSQGVIGSRVIQTVASLCRSAPLVFFF